MKEIDVFAQAEIAGIKFNNRILRAATDECLADENGYPTKELSKRYENLVKGGVGGIITGFMSVSKDGETTIPGMVMIESDKRITKLSELADDVHKAGAPIICQIAHCGKNGVAGKTFNVNKISEKTILRVIHDFSKAVMRAEKAGFDGVELHLAHGYFLSEMLSGHTNKRNDKWGKTTENRIRIVQEIMKEIRNELADYPILVKMNGDEIYENGIHPEEAAMIAQLLENSGVNAIEVSCGIDWKQMGPAKGKVPVDMLMHDYPFIKDLPRMIKSIAKPVLPIVMKEANTERKYNVPAAKKIKESVHIPVIAVGGIHDMEDIDSTINKDGIDFVAMCRPLILEPRLVNKYKEQKAKDAKCLSCNYCMAGLYGGQTRCYYGKVPKEN